MAWKLRENVYRSTVVCIDSYTNSVFGGRFYNSYRQDGEQFNSLMQFLLKMEQMLDEMNFPQSFSMTRTFAPSPSPAIDSPPAGEHISGRLATFEIRVLFRQNASWQGSVTWLEGEREEGFRSVLELATLMDSAISVTQKYAS